MYDRDNNGSLDADEVLELITDALKQMKQSTTVTKEDINNFIEMVDTDNSKTVSKSELF